MILNESEYNPLGKIFEMLEGKELNNSILSDIRAELFKGGVVPENDDEFNQVLDLIEVYFNKRK